MPRALSSGTDHRSMAVTITPVWPRTYRGTLVW